ncbi:hypothetical protein QVD17_25846 [Tagetes erecta]|uniref:Uncharacterized protein n=1 Tax=Tagetes erecta TaxID=13708 RepID=A0AAD8NI12_TARER|nr:hypothetical protein QVD17_25846 [Tagetes erecta]
MWLVGGRDRAMKSQERWERKRQRSEGRRTEEAPEFVRSSAVIVVGAIVIQGFRAAMDYESQADSYGAGWWWRLGFGTEGLFYLMELRFLLCILQELQNFDVVAGDVAIRSSRLDYLDFTQPYTESATITLYNGFFVWLIERAHSEYLRGSIMNQIGIIIWLALTTLFTLRGDKQHSNLSRMAMVVWLLWH